MNDLGKELVDVNNPLPVYSMRCYLQMMSL